MRDAAVDVELGAAKAREERAPEVAAAHARVDAELAEELAKEEPRLSDLDRSHERARSVLARVNGSSERKP